jgi:hypothetical protein
VLFGGIPATSYVVNNDNQIVAVSPAQAAGTLDITVVTPTGTSVVSTADQFTVTNAAAPSVTGLSLTSGSANGGDVLTINGSGFLGTTSVAFGTVSVPDFTVLSDTALVVTTPGQTAGTVHVTVTTYSGASTTSSADQFTASTVAAPAVSAVTPNSGSGLGGDTLVVTGSGFTGTTAVNVGTTAAPSFNVVSDTVLEVVTPSGVTGTAHITVTTPSGTSATSSADQFTFASLSAPVVSVLSISSGSSAGGDLLVITGTGFTDANTVLFGSTPIYDFVVNNDTQLTVLTPPQTAGTFDVQVVNSTGTSAANSTDRFTVTAASTPTLEERSRSTLVVWQRSSQ